MPAASSGPGTGTAARGRPSPSRRGRMGRDMRERTGVMLMDQERYPVILDTDIGTDVDDVVALGLLLRAPTVELRAITTVYVDAALRARIVRRVLDVAGRTGIPIGRGLDQPLLGRDPFFWEGWEGEGFLDDRDEDAGPLVHAVDLLIETVLAYPGEITIVAIGPLTNLAVAHMREPRLATAVRRIAIMG